MAHAFIIGSIVGAIIGLIHAGYVYFQRTREFSERHAEHPLTVRARAVYFAFWTLFLWTLLGSYVFYLWVISVVVYAIDLALKRFRIGYRPS